MSDPWNLGKTGREQAEMTRQKNGRLEEEKVIERCPGAGKGR